MLTWKDKNTMKNLKLKYPLMSHDANWILPRHMSRMVLYVLKM